MFRKKANKKGSHVIPHFLIKSMVNDNQNEKERDKEVSFKMESNFSGLYFGRGVLPDKIQEILRRDLTEEEVETIENHYVVDYFLCEQCEKRLSVIEAYYSEKSKSFTEKGKLRTNKVESHVALLFWYSILWRISVTGTLGLELKGKEEKRVRHLLNLCLSDNKKKLLENSVQAANLIDKHSYVILQHELVEGQVNKNFYVAHPVHKMPYCLLVNDFVIFFYMKSSHFRSVEQSFFSYEKYIKKELLNPCGENETIYILTEEEHEKAGQKMLSFKTDSWIRNWVKVIEETLLQIDPKMPGHLINQIKKEVITEMIQDESISLGEKYSKENFIKTFWKVVQRLILHKK